MIRIALLLLVAMLCMGSGTGVVATGGSSVSVAGGPGLTLINAMDFDSIGGTGCRDTDYDAGNPPYEDCTPTGTGTDPNCNTGTCPLNSSTYSLELVDNGDNAGNTSFTFAGAESTLDFKFAIENATATARTVAAIMQNNSATGCYMECAFISGTDYGCRVDAESEVNAGWLSATMDDQVEYTARITMNTTTDECDLYIGAASSDYGATDIGSDTHAATADLTSTAGQSGWRAYAGFDLDAIIDEIALCDGDAGSTEGRCDE